jgi:ribose-phosphate pyrophosphokinase
MHLIGEVKDKTAILVDDICDTAGTLSQAANTLKERGATRVIAAVTHGIFTGPAVERIEKSAIDLLLTTDSIPLKADAAQCSKIHVLSVAELLGKAIRRIHNSDSVSSLFI